MTIVGIWQVFKSPGSLFAPGKGSQAPSLASTHCHAAGSGPSPRGKDWPRRTVGSGREGKLVRTSLGAGGFASG